MLSTFLVLPSVSAMMVWIYDADSTVGQTMWAEGCIDDAFLVYGSNIQPGECIWDFSLPNFSPGWTGLLCVFLSAPANNIVTI
jgi:hypothetical protein